MEITATGHVSHVVNRPYDFTDDGGKQVQGVTRTVTLTSSIDQPPTVCKVPRDAGPRTIEEFDRFAQAVHHLDLVTLRLSLNGSRVDFVGVDSIERRAESESVA